MKIIATIHALLKKEELFNKIKGLYDYGIKYYRFNFAKILDKSVSMDDVLKELAGLKKEYPDINVMIDIPYPGNKIRINQKVKIRKINKGDEYILVFSQNDTDITNGNEINVYGCLKTEQLKVNDIIYYDMGQGGFEVRKIISHNKIVVRAKNNFTVYNKKSIRCGMMVAKNEYGFYLDKIFSIFEPDEIAFSFVENANDLEVAKAFQKEHKYKIVSKIESQKGIEHLDDIVKCSDIILLGRGDLCLDIDNTMLLKYQIEVCNICKLYDKEIYLATGFLESLENSIIPNRSEIVDLLVAIALHPNGIILNAATVASSNISDSLDFVDRAIKQHR